MIEVPSINSSSFDKGIANTADTLIILVTKLEEIEKIKKGTPERQKQNK